MCLSSDTDRSHASIIFMQVAASSNVESGFSPFPITLVLKKCFPIEREWCRGKRNMSANEQMAGVFSTQSLVAISGCPFCANYFDHKSPWITGMIIGSETCTKVGKCSGFSFSW